MGVDALGRHVDLPTDPQRVVSLVPSLTEYLISLGLVDRLVGRTKYCIHPAEQVQQIPTVGGTKNPDVATIQQLQPDLVIANKEENKAQDVERLTEAGIPVYVTDINSVGEAVDTLRTLARMFKATKAAQPLFNAIQEELALSPLRCIRIAAFIWREPWMLVGPGTYAGDLLRLCGGTNIAHAFSGRYPKVELTELKNLKPDVILLPDEPFVFTEQHVPELESYSDQIMLCDGTLLSWYGPRLPMALRTFRELLCTESSSSH